MPEHGIACRKALPLGLERAPGAGDADDALGNVLAVGDPLEGGDLVDEGKAVEAGLAGQLVPRRRPADVAVGLGVPLGLGDGVAAGVVVGVAGAHDDVQVALDHGVEDGGVVVAGDVVGDHRTVGGRGAG